MDGEKKFISYNHYGSLNFVREDLKGSHREVCLCYDCTKFKPGTPEDNCPIANLIYAVCIAMNVVTPVFECPAFVQGERYVSTKKVAKDG